MPGNVENYRGRLPSFGNISPIPSNDDDSTSGTQFLTLDVQQMQAANTLSGCHCSNISSNAPEVDNIEAYGSTIGIKGGKLVMKPELDQIDVKDEKLTIKPHFDQTSIMQQDTSEDATGSGNWSTEARCGSYHGFAKNSTFVGDSPQHPMSHTHIHAGTLYSKRVDQIDMQNVDDSALLREKTLSKMMDEMGPAAAPLRRIAAEEMADLTRTLDDMRRLQAERCNALLTRMAAEEERLTLKLMTLKSNFGNSA